jgi:hypothetical protein
VNKKILYLHVGMDKTGTSAIQWMMHENRELIHALGHLYYPQTGLWQDYSHHPFAFSMLNMGGYSEKHLNYLLNDLSDEVRGKNKVLISSECLFKATSARNFHIFLRYILNNFDQVKVIIYLRRQDSWVESRHKHSILSGSELGIEMLKKPHFCNYKQFIDRWAHVVGSDNIIVRPYERSQFTGGDIYSDFLSIFGLNLTGKYRLPTLTVNSSLGVDGCEFKKMCILLNDNKINMDNLNMMLLQYADVEKKYRHNNNLMSPLERLNLIQRYSEFNENIASEYLTGKNGKLFSEPLPDENEAWERYEGLTEERTIEISNFILQNNVKLFKQIKNAVEKGIKSQEPVVSSAAIKLKSMLPIKF